MNKTENQIMNGQMLDKITIYSVSAKLMQNGIITAHPDVDINGADLLAIMKISDGARFARIQCKGRTIKQKNTSCSIKIKKEYATGTFTCILNIQYLHDNSEHLFCFFVNDIRNRPDLWKEKSDYFSLALYGSTFRTKFDLFYFNESRIKALKEIIEKSEINKEFYYSFGKIEGTLSAPSVKSIAT